MTHGIIHSTPADLLGKLIFRSTLTGQFRDPDEKRFKASRPWLELEIHWLDGQNLAINEIEVFQNNPEFDERQPIMKCQMFNASKFLHR